MDTYIEYRVRPVTRYIVTRFEQQRVGDKANAGATRTVGSIGSVGNGEFDNADTAYAVGYALARADHERLGYPLGDERIRYPAHPEHCTNLLAPDSSPEMPAEPAQTEFTSGQCANPYRP